MKHGLSKWRAVALDLDRTTLTSSHTLTPRTLAAIRQVDASLAMTWDVSFGGMFDDVWLSDSSMAVCMTNGRFSLESYKLYVFLDVFETAQEWIAQINAPSLLLLGSPSEVGIGEGHGMFA